MKRSLCIAIMLVIFLVPALVHAKISLSTLEQIKFMSTDQLYMLFMKNADFVLINTLSPIEFNEIRIKGSINVPYSCLKEGRSQLPDDTSAKLIFYCKGPK